MIKCCKCNYICDEQMVMCPKCRETFKNVRVAQYGGVGGQQPQSWMPGSSPNSRNMVGGAFSLQIDTPMDSIMGRTRKDVESDFKPDISIESRLQQFHHYFEPDIRSYLPYKERQKIKEHEELQRREKFAKDTEKAVFENSPKFVQQNFLPKPEHIKTIESLLDEFRTNDDKRKSVREDQVIVVKPDGSERVASSKTAVNHMRNTDFDDFDDEYDQQRGNTWDSQFKSFPMGNSGNMVPMFSSKDVENYLGGSGLNQLNTFVHEPTIAFSPGYAEADEVDIVGEKADENDNVSPLSGNAANGETIERQLSLLKNPRIPDRLPGDPYQAHNLDEIRGQEGRGTKYPSKDLQLGYPAPTPHL